MIINIIKVKKQTIMKTILCIVLFLVSTSAIAQKKYVTVYGSNHHETNERVYLSGAIPSSMTSQYDNSIGYVLNLLADQGFSVEQMNSCTLGTNSSRIYVLVLMSKYSDASDTSAITTVQDDSDENVHEVARYNIQGIPVTKNEKGVQIVVYSNYTTKTIVIQ